MEGFQHSVESQERVRDWRDLKAESLQSAMELISGIDGYEQMDTDEKMNALGELIERLAEEGNHNRFVASEVARVREVLVENEHHERRMVQLGASK